MHLKGWQFLMLGIPFIIAGIVYLFSDDIVKNIYFLFPEHHEERTFLSLNKKAAMYLDIESKAGLYRKVQNKISTKQINEKWVAKNILYREHKKENPQRYIWKLQMVYPKKKIAIINGKVVHINDVVDGAQVVDIKKLSVLIKEGERLEWVTLFQ